MNLAYLDALVRLNCIKSDMKIADERAAYERARNEARRQALVRENDERCGIIDLGPEDVREIVDAPALTAPKDC